MALNLPTFYKRTASAFVFAAVMLTGLLWKNDWAFPVLVCIIEFLCFKEYVTLVRKIYPDVHWPISSIVLFTAIGLVFPVLMALHLIAASTVLPFWLQSIVSVSKTFVSLLLLLLAVLILIAYAFKQPWLQAVRLSVLGLFYISLPMVCLMYMHSINFIIPLALILMIWTNDTMAYLVGSFIGKTPFSSISPKKTWEGTMGGALLTVVGAAIFAHLLKYPIVDWIMLSLCAAVAGTLGDLLESKLKRMANIKDSGNIMPGHGGALDRFDSLLVATPFAFVDDLFFYVKW